MRHCIAVGALATVGILTGATREVGAQSLFVTAGIGTACQGSEGGVCQGQTTTLISTTGMRVTRQFVVAFRASRLDDASTGETSYYGAPPANPEIARLRIDSGRTMHFGGEFLVHPAPAPDQALSGFIGGGFGVTTARTRVTCVFGACAQPGTFEPLLGEQRSYRRSVSFVAGVDVAIVRGLIARGTVRLDDFGSELGAAHVTIEIGYRFGARTAPRAGRPPAATAVAAASR